MVAQAGEVSSRECLGEEISPVDSAGEPVDGVPLFVNAVANSVEPHVDCLGPTLFVGAVSDPTGSGVVSDDGRGRQIGGTRGQRG